MLEIPSLLQMPVTALMQLDAPPVDSTNRRRGGYSEVVRVQSDDHIYFVKRQRNMTRRSMRFPRPRPTYFFEWHFINVIGDTRVTPVCVRYDEQRDTNRYDAVLITEELPGYRALNNARLAGDSREMTMLNLGRTLWSLHQRRICHGGLHGEHIMVNDAGHVRLIDFERTRFHLSSLACATRDLKQLKKRTAWLGQDDFRKIISAYPEAIAAKLPEHLFDRG